MIDKNELMVLIDDFIAGNNQNLRTANLIECGLSQYFPNDEFIQDEVIEVLARYSPVGGDYLYKENAVVHVLIMMRERLSQDHLSE